MPLLEPLISIIAASFDPFGEGLANKGIDYVACVIPRHLFDFPDNREGIYHCSVAETEVENDLQREGIILRDVDNPHLVGKYRLQKRYI